MTIAPNIEKSTGAEAAANVGFDSLHESAITHSAAIEAFEANSKDDLTLEEYLANVGRAEIFTVYSRENRALLRNFRRCKSQANRSIRFAADALSILRNEANFLPQRVDPELLPSLKTNPIARRPRRIALK